MADFSKFRSLSTEQKVFLAVNILLLGKEAELVLKSDKENAEIYQQVYQELMKISAEVRLPYLGTFLRENSELAREQLRLSGIELEEI